jgi:DNA-binding IclR family transcriptional regulator
MGPTSSPPVYHGLVPDNPSRYSISLGAGLAILRCFTHEQPILGIAEIAGRVNLSRPNAHRYATTLVELGYLDRASSRRYQLGLRVADLGTSAIDSGGLRARYRPLLEQLRGTTGYSSALWSLDGCHVVCLDHLPSRDTEQLVNAPKTNVGVRIPVSRTSIGTLLLAFLEEDRRDQLLDRVEPLARLARGRKRLRDELRRVNVLGYAIGDHGWRDGSQSLAVPVRQGTDVPAAAGLIAHGYARTLAALAEHCQRTLTEMEVTPSDGTGPRPPFYPTPRDRPSTCL